MSGLDSVHSPSTSGALFPGRGKGFDRIQPLVTFLTGMHPGLARFRRAIALLVYAVLIFLSTGLAAAFTEDLDLTSVVWGDVGILSCSLILVRIPLYRKTRLGVGRWRFVGMGEVVRLTGTTALGSVLVGVLGVALPVLDPRPAVMILECVLAVVLIGGTWIGYRLLFELTQRVEWSRNGKHESPRRILVAGAGEAGGMIVHQMMRSGRQNIVGYVDDDPLRWGTAIHGKEVIGATEDLPSIVRHHRVDELLIAIPSADPGDLRRIVAICADLDIEFRVLPGLEEVLQGSVSLDQVREIRIEDLLGRDPVRLELPELDADLNGKTVLITGAAGSIGSELARQVLLHRPDTLLLLDQAESPLYFVERELRSIDSQTEIVPIIADILDRQEIRRLFEEWGPDRVFHAAAYKHVPMMECNVRQAVRNNVLGTWRVAEAAAEFGSERLLLVSTDKAVNPSSVMGATKRVAELLVLAFAREHPETEWHAVRFGNVLGSAGSVIPVFQKQLENGEPLTVTHEEVSRFFMTIPEAVQLVLQSSLLPEARGRIAMLEMGEPVKILDLAREMLRLSGRREGVDAEIRFTGLRPGEKLHEELVLPEENPQETSVPRIHVLSNGITGEALSEVNRRAFSLWQDVRTMNDDELREWLRSSMESGSPPADGSSTRVDSASRAQEDARADCHGRFVPEGGFL